MKIDLEAFGQRLREERQRLGFTQADFAEAGGVKRAAQFLYEKGDRAPNVDYISRLLEKGVNLRYLFLGDTPELDASLALEKNDITEAFQLTDKLCRDSKGRLLDYEHRQALFEGIIEMVSEQPQPSRDWEDIKARARLFLEAA